MRRWHWFIIGLTGLCLLTAPIVLYGQAKKKKVQYQYKVIRTGEKIEEFEETMNELAKQGWRMVNGTDHVVYLYRKIRAN